MIKTLPPKAVEVFKLVINAKDAGTTRAKLAEHLGTQPATVSMYLTQLRQHQLIDTINGSIFVASNKEAAAVAKNPDQLITTHTRGRDADPNSKASRALVVMTEMAGSVRKNVIEALVGRVGLTKAGAATYYQNLKGKVPAKGAGAQTVVRVK
jgi:hypothetical protein